uniref:Uncharacterized protein n=1 Tax=Aegilops tauschii subsp. strangulata TaxID=200361 RepID=A0A453K104_AEGTS
MRPLCGKAKYHHQYKILFDNIALLWQASSGDYILWNTLGKCPSAALPKEL